MAQPVIRVEGLGKEYVIGAREAGGQTFREMLTSSMAAPFRRFRRLSGQVAPEERIWALKDVSFEVKQGEVIGVIGRNGAGKSTLLKILSRITEPTEGRAEIRGRVASLLEVGTGFHPELTGRENVYLNGAILGMSRREIDRKFDEIVDFAGVETFLDTPVKRYSSGMAVRLAFAVAAHLEPEILIVDEVLAVGDAEFQKRCLGKMQEVSGEGRTVIFVSHNMAAIDTLCSRVIVLQNGQVTKDGDAKASIHHYLDSFQLETKFLGSIKVYTEKLGKQNHPIKISDLKVINLSRDCNNIIKTMDNIMLRIYYSASPDALSEHISFCIHLKTVYGQEIFRLSTEPISGFRVNRLWRQGYFDLTLEKLPLTGGVYLLDVAVARPGVEYLVFLSNIAALEVTPSDVYGTGVELSHNHGLVTVRHAWAHREDETGV